MCQPDTWIRRPTRSFASFWSRRSHGADDNHDASLISGPGSLSRWLILEISTPYFVDQIDAGLCVPARHRIGRQCLPRDALERGANRVIAGPEPLKLRDRLAHGVAKLLERDILIRLSLQGGTQCRGQAIRSEQFQRALCAATMHAGAQVRENQVTSAGCESGQPPGLRPFRAYGVTPYQTRSESRMSCCSFFCSSIVWCARLSSFERTLEPWASVDMSIAPW